MNEAKRQNVLKDSRLFVSASSLAALEYKADTFSLKPNGKVSSLRAGHHLSQFRGRGLSFEEYRRYQAGDDVRDIDWRVTMRTRSPMIKIFNDEKDLSVVLIVDQRLSMLFSSLDTMKSVVAAEIAALCSWRVVKGGDRIGMVIFNDTEVKWLPPKQSKLHLAKIINELVSFNRKLDFNNSEKEADGNALQLAIIRAARSKIKGGLFVIVSDFHGFDDKCKHALRQLQQANSVVGVQVFDPLEKELANDLPQFLTDGEQQLSTPNSSSEIAQKYASVVHDKTQLIKKYFGIGALPFIELNTDGQHIAQLKKSLDYRVY